MENSIVIGVTGGVGAGKSTVLQVLRERFHARVIEADAVAKNLMEPGEPAYRAVTAAFGAEICDADGAIDRGRLAGIVFASEEKRKLLNSLTHPLVFEAVQKEIREAPEELVIYESAIPEEARMRELVREIWYIYVPEEVRIARLMSSRGYSREKCLRVMASQFPEEKFRRLADRVIDNGGSPAETEEEIRKAVGEIKRTENIGKGRRKP